MLKAANAVLAKNMPIHRPAKTHAFRVSLTQIGYVAKERKKDRNKVTR